MNSSVTSNSYICSHLLLLTNCTLQPTKMGSWFSKSEPEIKDSQAILQSADSPIIQLNRATFSTGLSSIVIIIVLLILLGICYKKNRQSNRCARRLELHDIVHSLFRSTQPPEPSRQGFPQYPPSITGFGMFPNVFPMVAYPATAPPPSSTAIVPTSVLNLNRALTYAGPTPGTSGFPGVNSAATKREMLRIRNSRVIRTRVAPLPT